MSIKSGYRVLFIMCLLTLTSLSASMLLGESKAIEKETILQTSPEWQAVYDSYQPDESFLNILQSKVGKDLTIVVYLGTWCSDSKKNVPIFIKILDSLEQGLVTVSFFDVTRKANKDIKYYDESLKVERVPTFIFYRGDKEIGRIIENPQKTLLEDFLEIAF